MAKKTHSSLVFWILKCRRRVCFFWMLVILAGFFQLRELVWNTSPESWLLQTDPVAVRYREYKEKFGSDEFIIVGVESGDVLEKKHHWKFVQDLHDWLAKQDAIGRVESVVTATRVIARGPDEIQVVSSLPSVEILDNPHELESHVSKIKQDKLWRELVSSDLSMTPVVAWLIKDGLHQDSQLVENLRQWLATHTPTDITTYVSGSPVMTHDFYAISRQETGTNLAVLYAVFALTTALVFRRMRLVVAATGVILASNASMVIAASLVGLTLNNVTVTLPVLLLGISVGNVFHFFSHASKVETAIRHTLLPCTLTSATTIAGFLGLFAAPLAPLREMAVLAGIGILIAFAANYTLVPALLAGETSIRSSSIQIIPERLLRRFVTRLPAKTILFISLGVMIVSFFIIRHTRIGLPFIDFFSEKLPVHQDAMVLEEKFGSVVGLEFIIHTPQGLSFFGPENIGKLDDIENILRNEPDFRSVQGLAGHLKLAHATLTGEELANVGTLSAPVIQQYLFATEQVDGENSPQQWYVEKQNIMRVQVMTRMMSAQKYDELMNRLQKRFAVETPGYKIEATGIAALYVAVESLLYQSLMGSLISSTLLIALLMGLVYRSLKLMIAFLIPNVIPVLITLACLVGLGLRVDIGIVMMGSITLGIIVDDTIHLLHSFTHSPDSAATVTDRLVVSLGSTGVAILAATATLLLSFLAASHSDFVPNQHFGLTSVLTLAIGMGVEILVMPAMIKLMYEPRD